MTDIVRKSMTIGEGGTALAFVALGTIAIFVAANAYTAEYAFHAYLVAAASAAAVFVIVNRYYDRPPQLAPGAAHVAALVKHRYDPCAEFARRHATRGANDLALAAHRG